MNLLHLPYETRGRRTTRQHFYAVVDLIDAGAGGRRKGGLRRGVSVHLGALRDPGQGRETTMIMATDNSDEHPAGTPVCSECGNKASEGHHWTCSKG